MKLDKSGIYQCLWIHSVATKVASRMNLKTLPQKRERGIFSSNTFVVNTSFVLINRVLNTCGMNSRKSYVLFCNLLIDGTIHKKGREESWQMI